MNKLISKVALLGMMLVIIVSCNSDDDLTSAIITGFENTGCECCAGYMVTFSGNPEPYEAEYYLANEIPDNIVITPSTDFPKYVLIEFDYISDCEGIKRIKIDKLKFE